jgi:hypothetical protein
MIWIFITLSGFALALLHCRFKEKQTKANNKKRYCVMCNGQLSKQYESKHWQGAHEWCEKNY